VIGGGSAPGHHLPSWGVRVRGHDAVALATRLRDGSPPVFCRVEDGAVVLDVRTVSEEQVPHLARAVQYGLEADEPLGA
jgi:L-seryl-tRNA(Ser) seleniumtransferase